jgi:hypothetical protein
VGVVRSDEGVRICARQIHLPRPPPRLRQDCRYVPLLGLLLLLFCLFDFFLSLPRAVLYIISISHLPADLKTMEVVLNTMRKEKHELTLVPPLCACEAKLVVSLALRAVDLEYRHGGLLRCRPPLPQRFHENHRRCATHLGGMKSLFSSICSRLFSLSFSLSLFVLVFRMRIGTSLCSFIHTFADVHKAPVPHRPNLRQPLPSPFRRGTARKSRRAAVCFL